MYVYKGKDRAEPKPAQPKRQPQPCGTNAAYNRHHRYGEEPCQPCKDAHADYMKASRPPARQLVPCGTVSAYRRHYARGEKPCRECVAAQSVYKKQWKRRNSNGLGMNRKKTA